MAFFKWLLRRRDQCSVTYSRFGLPGDAVDDRPPPSRIFIESFDDSHPDFMFYKTCHSTKAAIASAAFGMSMVILFFLSSFFKFDWYNHTTGVDTLTLLIMFFFLFFGVLVHYDVMVGVRRQSAHYLLPFIVVYSMAIGGSMAMFFYFATHLHYMEKYGINERTHSPFIFLLIVVSVVIFVQANMLLAVLKCRLYLTRKAVHAVTLKVAEKSRVKYPGIEVVVANQNGPRMEISVPEMSVVEPLPECDVQNSGASGIMNDNATSTTTATTTSTLPYPNGQSNGSVNKNPFL